MLEQLPSLDTIQQFHLLRPQWLWALVPLAIIWFASRSKTKSQTGWATVLPNHLLTHLVADNYIKQKKPPIWLLALGWILATFALAGPTWERLPQPVYQLATGKVVVMDMSLSMFATDLKPNRLTRARFKAIDLVNSIKEGEIGLIAYAGDAFVISPLSNDSQNLAALIPSLSPEIMPEPGSDPVLAIERATELLRNAGHLEGEIFLITDGMEYSESQDITQQLASSNYRLSVLSIGTQAGAPIKLPQGELLKDHKGAIVVPGLEVEPLQSVASSGRYVNLRSDDKDIQYLLDGLAVEREHQQQQETNSFGDQWKEAAPYLLVLMLPFAAYAFRRGLILICASVLLLPPPANADWWNDLWQTKNQQAQQSFNQQAFNMAADQFQNPQWKASAQYKAGDYQAALEGFSNDNSAQGLYNQGNALAQLNQLDDAIEAYKQALQKQADFPEAQANLELLEQLQQQQQNDQQQPNNQDNQQQEQDQNSQNDSEQNQEQQSQDSEQQNSSEQNQQSDSEQQNDRQPSPPEEADNQQGEQQEQQQASEQQEQQDAEQQPEQSETEQQEEQSQQQAQPRELSKEELEQQQKLEQWLRKVPDDPSLLLRNKMKLEYQQRRMNRLPSQRKAPGTQKQW